MKNDETHSWGRKGLSPFVVSKCNCLNATSNSGVPRLTAGTWGGIPRKGNLTLALSLLLFFLCSFSWHLWSGYSWEWYGQWCWSRDTFQLVVKGENIPSSGTQCLLLDPVPADCDLFQEVGRAPREGVDVIAMSLDFQLAALKSYIRIIANVVAMPKATCLCVLTPKICVFKICSRKETSW